MQREKEAEYFREWEKQEDTVSFTFTFQFEAFYGNLCELQQVDCIWT